MTASGVARLARTVTKLRCSRKDEDFPVVTSDRVGKATRSATETREHR